MLGRDTLLLQCLRQTQGKLKHRCSWIVGPDVRVPWVCVFCWKIFREHLTILAYWHILQYHVISYNIQYSVAFFHFKHFQARIAQKAEENISQGASEAQHTESTWFIMSSLLPLFLKVIQKWFALYCSFADYACPLCGLPLSFAEPFFFAESFAVNVVWMFHFHMGKENWQSVWHLLVDVCWCTCGSRHSRCM